MKSAGKECMRIDALGNGAFDCRIWGEAGVIMSTTRWYKRLGVAMLGLVLTGLTGCQTWVEIGRAHV